MIEKRLMSVKECAEYLHIGLNNAYKLCRQADFPVVKIGNKKMVDIQALDEVWLPHMEEISHSFQDKELDMNEKRYYTIRELAKEDDCPLSEYMLRKLIDEKRLPHIRVGKKYILDKVTFARWLEKQKF